MAQRFTYQPIFFFFFFNDTATTEIYTLSLHDALPISSTARRWSPREKRAAPSWNSAAMRSDESPSASPRVCAAAARRSEEHTSELQSRLHLVCRLLLEKKKKNNHSTYHLIYYNIKDST